jgi:lipoprotein-anchoring transpeptidase ErfK/SrfK
MSVPSRKKPPARRRKSGRWPGFFLVILLVAAGLYWFEWHTQHSHPRKLSRHKKVETEAATEPAPAPVPNPGPGPIPVPASANPAPPLNQPPIQGATNSPGLIQSTPPPATEFPRPVRDPLEMQIALARRVFSPGSIDGAAGHQTRAALAAFQRSQNLSDTGLLDTNTRAVLTLDSPITTTYTVTTNDLAGLQPLGKTWLEKSQQSALAFETELELVGEKSHANPLLIKKLNPGVDWPNPVPGTVIQVPDVTYPEPADKAAFVIIHLADRYLEAFDLETNLIAHFPCSIAAKVEKRPVGQLQVIVIAPHPNYTVNPELFPESTELQAIGHKLILPPGPNNPVGIAWIGLDRPGYGMHGTPIPEQVGRTESHGCFRLANWDAEYLLKLAWVGMPVFVEP